MRFEEDFSCHEETVFPDGLVIGARALGCKRIPGGAFEDKPQESHVEVGGGSEIGANTVIHKGSWRPTTIGRGARIGSLVNIGHNVQIEENALICPYVSIGGSTDVGKNVTIWMGAKVAQHLKIGDGAEIGMSAVVMKDVPAGAVVWGNPAEVKRTMLPETAADFEGGDADAAG